jgi:hypothetical protein
MNAGHVLRVETSLKGLLPNTTYDVWLINCASTPGGHPASADRSRGPDRSARREVSPDAWGAAGPLATVTTNAAGNANTGAVHVDLSDVPAGTYSSGNTVPANLR